MQVKISQAAAMVAKFIRAKIVVMLHGSPAIGKSAIVQQVANEYGLKLIDLRLAQCDPTDLAGFPTITGEKASYMPMDTFPIEGDVIPKGYNGWLLFLDELNSAAPAIQSAAYKVILDRMVGNHKLHKNVAIVAAGNLESDNAIVQPMSTALQSRMAHLELVVDAKEWVDWASSNGVDHRITSYINFRPDALYTFSPDHTDKTYASPRTWEFANRVLQVAEAGSSEALPMLSGTISEGVAREFLGFCKIHMSLPKMAEIIANPTGITVPNEPSILFAMTGAIGNNANKDNIGALMKFILRLPVEFQVVTLRETIRRNKELIQHEAVRDWVTKSATDLF